MVMLVESVWKATIGIKYFSYNGFFFIRIYFCFLVITWEIKYVFFFASLLKTPNKCEELISTKKNWRCISCKCLKSHLNFFDWCKLNKISIGCKTFESQNWVPYLCKVWNLQYVPFQFLSKGHVVCFLKVRFSGFRLE